MKLRRKLFLSFSICLATVATSIIMVSAGVNSSTLAGYSISVQAYSTACHAYIADGAPSASTAISAYGQNNTIIAHDVGTYAAHCYGSHFVKGVSTHWVGNSSTTLTVYV